jgi:hypothetical protein
MNGFALPFEKINNNSIISVLRNYSRALQAFFHEEGDLRLTLKRTSCPLFEEATSIRNQNRKESI